MEIAKVIDDPIHKQIPLTKLESSIIQTKAFNRLHQVKQQSSAFLVFPGATHTRFTHSLGTMKIASEMATYMLHSLSGKDCEELFPSYSTRVAELIQVIRLVALLHDIGHGPFSHTSEDVMKAVLERKGETEKALSVTGDGEIGNLHVHEYSSYKLITTGEIRELIEAEGISPLAVASLLFEKSSPRESLQKGHEILHQIISSNLDADRMDYLIRDSYFSGMPYGSVDYRRIISNIAIRPSGIGSTKAFKMGFHERSISSIEDMLDTRYKMYKWFVGHHLVVAFSELLRQAMICAISDGKMEEELFYWKTFSHGTGTDSNVQTALQKMLLTENSNEYSWFKGIFDREYAPISLIKRPGADHWRFIQDVDVRLGRDESDEYVRARIDKLVDELDECPTITMGGKNIRILSVREPRTPYQPMTDPLYVYSNRNRNITELSRESPYFRSVNESWVDFPRFYFSYVVNNSKKQDGKKIRDKVWDEMVSRAAEESR